MQDAASILESLFETCLYGTVFLYLFFWIAERKPTNFEALYIFAGVLAVVLVTNFVDSSNFLLLFLLLNLMPSHKRKQS
jgi:hypothetical protein